MAIIVICTLTFAASFTYQGVVCGLLIDALPAVLTVHHVPLLALSAHTKQIRSLSFLLSHQLVC